MDNQDTKEPLVTSEAPQPAIKNKKMFVYGFIGLLIGVVIVAVLVGVVRVYKSVATDRFSVGVARALNLPAFKINGVTVPYESYVEDLKAIHIMRDFDRANGGQGAGMTDTELSDQVVMRLTNNILVEQAAAKFGVTVEQADIDALKNQVLAQYQSVSEVDAELMKRYGWDFATYEAKVMRPYVLQSKLNEKFQGDAEARATVRASAQEVLEKIKAGADFAQMAMQYGQDGTKANGGDLGWFGKGEMVPQFEAAAFALKKGEVTKDLVESPFGYHIIKVEDKKTVAGKDVSGKTVNEPQVQARHILFMFPTLQKYLQTEILNADISFYLDTNNPIEKIKTQAAAPSALPTETAPSAQ